MSFPPETLAFLAALRDNNSKAWFDEHRREYDEYVLEPARDFVEAIGAELGPTGARPPAGERIDLPDQPEHALLEGQAALQGPPRPLVLAG